MYRCAPSQLTCCAQVHILFVCMDQRQIHAPQLQSRAQQLGRRCLDLHVVIQSHEQSPSDTVCAIASLCLCAATVHSSPGTLVEVWLTFLQPELLLRMHATEGAYDLLQLQDIDLHVGSSVPACRCVCVFEGLRFRGQFPGPVCMHA